MALAMLLAYLLIILTSIYLLFRLWFKINSSKLRRVYVKQNLKFVKVPNIMVQAYWGHRPELIEHEAVLANGKVFGSDLFGTKTIYVAEPELIQLVLSKEFTSFTNRRKITFEDPVLRSFLTITSDDQWKRIRSIVTPTFSAGKLKLMKPRIDDAVKSMMTTIQNDFKKSPIINVKEMYGAYTMDTILQVAFGTKADINSDPNKKIASTAKSLFSKDVQFVEMAFLAVLFAFPKVLSYLSKIENPNDPISFFKTFSLKIIAEKREKMKNEATTGKANNFLEMLLEAEKENETVNEEKGEEGKKAVKFMNNDELLAQCVLFFLAAYDTTTATLSLVTFMLSQNQFIQDKLHQEIVEFLDKLKAQSEVPNADPLSLITFESLSQLEYLNAVISETLRLYPPAATERIASRDLVLETEDGLHKLFVKKDDVIRLPIYTIHRDPVQFPDPEKFNPSRFLGETTHHKYAYLPFSLGPRNCVARSLALYEVKIALINVVYQYQVSTCEKTHIPVQFYNNGQVLTPKDILLQLKKR